MTPWTSQISLLRKSKLNNKSLIPDPRSSILDPRSLILDPRSCFSRKPTCFSRKPINQLHNGLWSMVYGRKHSTLVQGLLQIYYDQLQNTKKSYLKHVNRRTKWTDLQQICNRPVLAKTDHLQTNLSSAESVFCLQQTIQPDRLQRFTTADGKQIMNRSAADLFLICNFPESRNSAISRFSCDHSRGRYEKCQKCVHSFFLCISLLICTWSLF